MDKIKKSNTYLIFGFPGIGKTYFTKNIAKNDLKYKYIRIADLDAGDYIWNKDKNGNKIYDKERPGWLDDYKKAIKEKIDSNYRIIFVSTHFEVIDFLKDIENVEKIIVIPTINLKQHYLDLYKLRKSSEHLQEKINKNFEFMLFTIKDLYKKYHEQYSFKLIQFTKKEDNVETLLEKIFS